MLGVDEFAFRKGCTYGTTLVAVEVGRVVDVLPDRTSETFAAWLKDHPGAEIICRDRATAYTKAVKEVAPNALEIADRWHLLQNLSAAVEKTCHQHRNCLRKQANRRQSRPCRNRSRWNCRRRNFPAPRSSNGPVTATRTSTAWWRRAGRSAPSPGG
ncbi:transposase [Streptomyces sp. NPDC020801]|uniref:transposase n=1 Tax=unclassified Streptomyces TaxID=2593676 RepID=UPI00379DCA2F